mmetsp:Transcript_11984/g.26659  ORF Transcript_11984/g.26659 Transcript_11984/m.26659 type:complete len:329 (-) Transcript_11984:1217-2203(-)
MEVLLLRQGVARRCQPSRGLRRHRAHGGLRAGWIQRVHNSVRPDGQREDLHDGRVRRHVRGQLPRRADPLRRAHPAPGAGRGAPRPRGAAQGGGGQGPQERGGVLVRAVRVHDGDLQRPGVRPARGRAQRRRVAGHTPGREQLHNGAGAGADARAESARRDGRVQQGLRQPGHGSDQPERAQQPLAPGGAGGGRPQQGGGHARQEQAQPGGSRGLRAGGQERLHGHGDEGGAAHQQEPLSPGRRYGGPGQEVEPHPLPQLQAHLPAHGVTGGQLAHDDDRHRVPHRPHQRREPLHAALRHPRAQHIRRAGAEAVQRQEPRGLSEAPAG